MPFTIRKSGKGKGRGNNSKSSHYPKGKSGNYAGRPRKKKEGALDRTATQGLVDTLIRMREVHSKEGVKRMTAMQMLDELFVAALPKASLSELIKAMKIYRGMRSCR